MAELYVDVDALSELSSQLHQVKASLQEAKDNVDAYDARLGSRRINDELDDFVEGLEGRPQEHRRGHRRPAGPNTGSDRRLHHPGAAAGEGSRRQRGQAGEDAGPVTTLSWDLVGGDPAPGDPRAYGELARDLKDTAESAQRASDRLRRFTTSVDASIWRGDAADAFRDKLGEFPPQLAKLQRSYASASEAMAGYGRTLDDLQDRARRVLERAHAAAEDEASQQRNAEAEAEARAADPLVPSLGTPATAPFDDAIDDAQGRLRMARNEIYDIEDQRRAAEARAIDGLERAQEQGIQNDPWYTRAWKSVDRWVDEHADLLKKISGALKWVSGIAGVLSLIPGLAPIFGPIALIAGGLALGIDALLAVTGNGDWKTLLVDAALMVLPGAGKLASTAIMSRHAATLAGKHAGSIRHVNPRGERRTASTAP